MSIKTRSIISPSREPAFNLAAEEYLLRQVSDDVHFFYINTPSVIIGKHQNALAEINLDYLEENNIPLLRRLSGGGTVYHDEGNLNFCFIKNGESHDLVNFIRATEPIVATLNDWGIPARNGKRNDLLVHFKKISGNACHVFKRRVMHHGTLLFDSELDKLTSSLKNDPLRFKDKAVKSVRSEVMNISEIFNKVSTTDLFLINLEQAIRERSSKIITSEFSENEILTIQKIRDEKYSTQEWNYSYGPGYVFRKRTALNGSVYAIEMKVEKGKISDLKIKTNNPDAQLVKAIIEVATGKHHLKSELHSCFSQSPLLMKILSPNELTGLFF